MKKFSKLVTSFFLIALGVFVFNSVGVEASAVVEVNNAQEYQNYLEKEAEKDSEAQETLEQFKNLSKDDQEKLVGYLNDPDVFEELMDSVSTLKMGESRKIENNDIELSKEFSTSADVDLSQGIRPFAVEYNRVARITHSQKILGVKITSFTSYVKYTRSLTKMLDTYDNGASIKNLNPTVSISKDVRGHWNTSTKAFSETIWTGAFMKSSAIVHDKLQQVNVNYNDNVSGYIKNLY